jgi:putative CocE/NonD family hydrolase
MTSTRFGDRAVSRALHLPAPTTGYRVHRRLAVPMRDGVQLRADHYEPLTDQPLGTILVRCPYGRGFPFSFIYAQVYAARGYHVVLQSVRGTFGSGGTFVPMVHEADDAADTVVWLREQPWFTGTFGTIGLSYLGYAQWALLSDPPPELAAAVISVGMRTSAA